VSQRQSELALPADFAKKIAETLNWKLGVVEETFNFNEDKDGYFWATLKPKKFLDKPDFQTMCRLARDLGGEDYLKGARAWRVPSAYAKKGPAGPQEKSSGQGTDTQPAYKEPGNAVPATPSSSVTPNIKLIPVDGVRIPTFLPTRALISDERLSEIRLSIKKHGLKYPIKVRPGPDPNSYELIDGYVRLKSVQQLDWKEVPAEITPASDQEVVIDSIITNKDRIEEDPITVAKKLDILVNAFGYTHEKVAEELSVSRSWVSDTLRLLKLPLEIQQCLARDNVSRHHGLLLLTLENPELQLRLAKEAVEERLSTRDLEIRIREVQPKPEASEKHEESLKPTAAGESPTTREETICARCGEAVEHPVNLEGKFYCAACAEAVVEEAKKGLHQPPIKPEVPSGPTEPCPAEKAALKAVPIGEFDCTECHKHFLIEHLPNGEHKLRFVREAEG
jgi:ParB family chromosome partitioning protein